MKPMNKAVLPAVGLGVAAAATLGAVMMRPRKKKSVQAAAGKAIKAVGEAVEHFSSGLKYAQNRADREGWASVSALLFREMVLPRKKREKEGKTACI